MEASERQHVDGSTKQAMLTIAQTGQEQIGIDDCKELNQQGGNA